MMRFLEHFFGLDTPNGDWYLFWSGFGSDLPIVAGVAVFLRHRNCHTAGCWRLQHHPHPNCRRCSRRSA